MLRTTLDSSFVHRLKEILASRYGKGLQIRQLMDLTDVAGLDVYTRGRDLHIPIRVNGNILGTAIVPSADDLNEENRDGVTQLIRMVLEPAMYKWYLDQREANLSEINKAQVCFDNIRVFGDEPMPSLDEILDSSPELNKSLGKELITNLVHLEGASPTTNKKVALRIHEMTSHWAFVPFDDIKGDLHSSYDIAKLGAMTIYIEKIESLKSPEQELILEYLSEDRLSGEPLIITSSQMTIKELRETSLMSPLLDEASINAFEVDRAPLSSASLTDVLELFFMKDCPPTLS